MEESFFANLFFGIQQTSWLEWIAVITGLLYVIFAAMKHQLCWLFAIISSGVYVYICVTYYLYIESALQLFYVAMAVAGWVAWNKTKPLDNNNFDILDPDEKQVNRSDIKTWSISSHALNIGISAAVTLIVGLAFDQLTNQANPYADAFTTVFSLTATLMVVRKVLENWIYWVVIDFVGIYLYSERGLTLTAVLYGGYTIIAIFGFFAWYKRYKGIRT